MAFRFRFLLLLLLAGLSVDLWVGPARAQPDVLMIDRAELAVAAWTRAELRQWWAMLRDEEQAQGTELAAPSRLPSAFLPPADPKAWQAVRLPDVPERGRTATTDIEMRWYRLKVPALRHLGALYLPRVLAQSATVLLRTDAGWRVLLDNQPARREHWPQPVWTSIPAAGSEPLELVLALPVDVAAPCAVSRAWIGSKELLEPTYEQRMWLQSGVPQAIAFTLLVLGCFALMLWFKAPSETGHVTFALATAVWMARSLHHFIEVPEGAAANLFWWIEHVSLGWVVLLVFVTALRFAHLQPRRLLLGLTGAVLLASVINLPIGGHDHARNFLHYLITASVVLVAAVYVNAQGWQRARWGEGRELRIIGAALVLGLLLGLHDLLVLGGWAWPEQIYLMPFAALAVMLSFMYAVQRRYVGRVEEAIFQNSQLQQSLDLQADALAAQTLRAHEAERQRALLMERQRLMADMHDGLGSSLLTALVAAEQGKLTQQQLVELLQECVEDLRLVIDSLEPVSHDLVALLATLRYRLGKRLRGGGLEIDWDVQDLPRLPWLEPPDALHVLRLIQEALNNVVKHAHAKRVRLATRDCGAHVEICVEDDGQGFEMMTVRRGRGLKSQIKRAQRLGGKLTLESTPGSGTRLTLRLPLERPKPAPVRSAP